MRQIWGEWKPDQPEHLQDGLSVADGCVPIANGYAPLSSFSAAVNGTLAAACVGAGGYRTDASTFLFAATATNIYRYTAAGYSSLKSGMTSSTAVGMRFCPYNDLMLMTNGANPIQQFDPASPSATTDLDASAPTARFLAVVRGFVVAGYADDDPLAVAWSDNGDPTTWTPGTGEAGLFLMPSGGDVTGVVGGEYGLIFQENRIVRMTYTADDAIWQFDEIATDVGCVAPWSLATYGKITFFLSTKGLMACDGVSVEAIGSEKVDRTFLDLLDRSYIDNISAVVDPTNSLYLLGIPNSNPTNKVIIYNYALQRFTTASISSERMFSALALGTDIEGLDAIYGNLDAITLSLDSALFRGGYPLVMLFDGSHQLGGLNGANLAATFEDVRRELFEGSRARVRSVRPLTNASTATVTVSGANSLSDDMTATAYTNRTSDGIYRTRESWNLTKVKVEIPAGAAWSYAQGYDIEAVPGGRA